MSYFKEGKTYAPSLFHIPLRCVDSLLIEHVVTHPYIFSLQIDRVIGCHQYGRRVVNQEKLHISSM